MDNNHTLEAVLITIRYISLILIFLWAFYRAFVSVYLIRRIGFALITFTTIGVIVFIQDSPITIPRLGFYGSLGFMAIIDFSFEINKSRFWASFSRVSNNIRDKIEHTIH